MIQLSRRHTLTIILNYDLQFVVGAVGSYEKYTTVSTIGKSVDDGIFYDRLKKKFHYHEFLGIIQNAVNNLERFSKTYILNI